MNKNSDFDVVKEIFSWISIIVVAAVIALVLNLFIIANSRVPSASMENTIMTGDRGVGFRLTYLFQEPKRGDVIIFKFPDDESLYYVKRIIGEPGDIIDIKDGKIYLNNSETPLEEDYIKEPMIPEAPMHFEVPEGSYFCMGDNRNNSADSRRWFHPFVHKDKIIAKVIFRYFPGFKMIK